MLKNYLTLAFRNFFRERFHTLLNILGLSLGLAASILIFQYVKYELSFDRFHANADNIYRIQYNQWQNGQLGFQGAVCLPAVAPELKNNFPEVIAYTRFFRTGGVISYEKPGEAPIVFREEKAFFADSSLFKVFDFGLVKGDERTCLKGLNKIIISEAVAAKHFAGEDPIGKRILLADRDGMQYVNEVTGVFANVPENSHIKFDFLVSYETISAMADNLPETSWEWRSFYTYVLLREGTDVNVLQKKWDAHVARVRGQEWSKQNAREEFILRPVTEIHLFSNLLEETVPKEKRDGDSVFALRITGIFILIIAWINYINAVTARSIKRANEVGVRKVMGAVKAQLITQFFAESLLLNIVVVVVSLLLVRIFWEPFSTLTGWHIPVTYMLQSDFFLLVIILFVAGTLISGLYPAIVLSSFKPVAVLKGKVFSSPKGNYLRQALVIFQFTAAVFLISSSLIVYNQLMFMKNQDLGIDLNETVVLKGPLAVDSLYEAKFESFKLEIMRIPGISGISTSSGVPGLENYWTSEVQRVTAGPRVRGFSSFVQIDPEFVPQYGLQVKAGRNFSTAFNDEYNVLINEELVSVLGFTSAEDAIGQKLRHRDDELVIVGVVSNYHQMSLRSRVMPHVFKFGTASRFYSVKMQTQNYRAVIGDLSTSWKTFFPGNSVDYFFLDEFFNQQYERDDRFGAIFSVFTALAIIVAAMGLLALASFMTIRRTKEIGIRKVLGASASGIVFLLSRQFIRPVLIAIVIAFPLTWILMTEWLESFSYHTAIGAGVFLVSGVVVLLVAFFTVSTQTLKASLTKPAETLKCE